MRALSELAKKAGQRLKTNQAGKTRVVVQVGHCSGAVDASDLAAMLSSHLADRSDAYLVNTGCDGACFAAPQVAMVKPSGELTRYAGVTSPIAQQLADSVNTTKPASRRPSTDNPSDDLENFFNSQHRLLLAQCGWIDPSSIDEYLVSGGYGALSAALAHTPEEVIELVLGAGLLGRGGAYFPAARKWQSARSAEGTPKYLVVNAEEGEPGIFKDRHLMEGDPHRLLEGMLIAAYCSGASTGYLYVNAEANLSAERVETAVQHARSLGIIGSHVLGHDFSFEVEIRRGAGGYVCGEETTLLDTIQGSRREPRLRPPFPTESGLFYKPTVINNVETLSNVPFLVDARIQDLQTQPGVEIPLASSWQRGARDDIHSSLHRWGEVGPESARGTKLICLSGAVRRTGVVEVPMGTTLRQVIYEVGGGLEEDRSLGIIAVGGPSSGVLPASELDTPLLPGMLHPAGVVMGAGGIVVLDDTVPVIDVVHRLAAYNAAESCGKCTPCREGTPRMVEILDRLALDQGTEEDLGNLRFLAEIVGSASLCGLGQMAGGPINSALHFFGEALGRPASL